MRVDATGRLVRVAALVVAIVIVPGGDQARESAGTRDITTLAVSDSPAREEPIHGHAGLADPSMPTSCPLCTGTPPVPIRILDVASARAIGQAYSDSNIARIVWIDSLLQAAAFGPPEDKAARRSAHLLTRLLTLNAYAYMIRFGTDPDTVWQADESVLRPAFETFSDPGIVPLARLRVARMGLGHMCAEYDLREKLRTETVIGGQTFEVRIDDIDIARVSTRVLIMDLPTSLNDVVEVCIAEHVCMDVELVHRDGPPAPYDAFIVDHMRGLWVRKAGLHRPEAFVFWVTPRDPLRDDLPAEPLIGARIYVPHLKLRLPLFPDIGFEDLREVDLPQPILPIEYLRDDLYPTWLRSTTIRGFKGWEGVGPLPPWIRARFPDL